MVDRFVEFMSSTNNLKNIQFKVKEARCGKWGGKKGEITAKVMYEIYKKHLQYVDDLNDQDVILNDFLQEVDRYYSYFRLYRHFAQKI